jgi:YegS/Rv2252/BmrU family lipid kinase
MRTAVVMNPRSAGGRTGRTWKRIRPQLEAACGPVAAFETEAPGHGIRLTSDAVRSGFSRILAFGGDGTLNEVVNGVLTAGPEPNAEVGLIPQGTGSDFRRALGMPLDATGAIGIIRAGKTKYLDVMKVAYTLADGAGATRYAINLTSFGMGGRVAARANRSSKPLGGRVTFLAATLVTALGYRGDRVSLELDEVAIADVRITNVAVGNGPYHGAGMRVCPRAAVDDGLLDVSVITKLSPWELLTSGRYMFNGRIYEHPKVRFHRTSKLVARAVEGTSAIEIDGEALGYLPIRIEVVPRALRMIVP